MSIPIINIEDYLLKTNKSIYEWYKNNSHLINFKIDFNKLDEARIIKDIIE